MEQEAEALSGCYAVPDIQQAHRGMMIALPAPLWERFRDMAPAEMASALREMARAIDLPRYRNSTPQLDAQCQEACRPEGVQERGHVSTHELPRAGAK